jgi:3-deoxy-D-manno-octulosonic-acid transferase
MSFVYTLFLHLYYIGLRLFSITNSKAKLWYKGRQEQAVKVKSLSLKNCIWFHASSLGEFEQVSFLIETIKLRYPKEKILVTFFSPSGYEIKKNFKFADEVLYLPFDFKKPIEDFISTIQPKLVFWVRYEFWLNALSKLKEENIPLILLNGVFRENTSHFYKPYLQKCLYCFSEITVINTASQKSLFNIGYSSTLIHDTRYSRMNQIIQTPFEDKIIQHFVNNDKVLICGSIWSNDDVVLETCIKRRSDIRWILVPHEVDAHRIDTLSRLYTNAQLYSQYDENIKSHILIIDCIGLLSRIYRFADLAYVGGGFNKVVHSLVEPLAYSLPIITGPRIEKSEEAKEFVSLGFVKQVKTNIEFDKEIDTLFASDLTKSRQQKHKFFNERVDSIEKILALTSRHIHLDK